ncbi:MAG: hypothetical protein HOP31_11860 [Ignavibacteria bacterium]|nr:hypothetical protein [Ignavibacteria bacterium]
MNKLINFLKLNYYKGFFFVMILFVLAAYSGGCGDSVVDPVIPSGGTVSTTVSGIVLNENKEPVAGATVTVHGSTVQTGAGGEFTVSNLTVPAERLFVNVSASGYFNATRAEFPKSADVTQLKITMIQKTVTHTINSGTGGSADLTNGSKVELQPNSVVTQGGALYSGTINMSVVYMDPTSVSFSETVQGGDMAALRSDSSASTLYSFGILKVILEGTGGESLQLSNGSTSTITSTIPASMVSSAPSTIPLWFFDEQTGLWREDGTATKQGDKYVGSVSHFTDWNCDLPGSFGTVTGRVLDCGGLPLPGITLKVGQVTTTTDASGNYSRNIPAGIGFTVSIEPSQNFGITGNPVNVPPVTAGNTVTLPDFNLDCYPILKGIFTDCDGNALYGTVSAKWDNQIQTAVPNNSSGFRMTVAPNKTATIRFVSPAGLVKDTIIQTPLTATTLDLGTIRLCGQVQQGENSFTINGAGFNNVYVNLNATAAIGLYYVGKNETAITAVNGSGENLALFFPGNTTGTFSGQNGYLTYQGITFSSAKSLNVSVTTYEGVGGIIEGTFNGTFDSPQGTAQITGMFFVTRQPDQN